jgi:hypothetical protein
MLEFKINDNVSFKEQTSSGKILIRFGTIISYYEYPNSFFVKDFAGPVYHKNQNDLTKLTNEEAMLHKLEN